MKALLAALLALLSFGCVSSAPDRYDGSTWAFVLDFSAYGDAFLITPHDVSGKYVSVGRIELVVWPTVEWQANAKADFATGRDNLGAWHVDQVDSQSVLDRAVDAAKALGADAIIDFKIDLPSREVAERHQHGPMVVHGVHVTGVAIRRLQAAE